MNSRLRHYGLVAAAFAMLGLAACASTKEENAEPAPEPAATEPAPADMTTPPPADATPPTETPTTTPPANPPTTP